MVRRFGVILGLLLAVALGAGGCNNAPSAGGSGTPVGGDNSSGDDSVGDVGSDAGSGGTERPVPFEGAARAKIRNESSDQVDVTLRFLRDNDVIQLAFVRVSPATVTMVAANDEPERLELTNITHRGRVLPNADFVFGVDFNADEPAEYVVRDGAGGGSEEPGTQGPALTVVEPSSDSDRLLGTTLLVRWNDEAASDDAQIRFFLRRQGDDNESEWAALGAASMASVDGLGDEAVVIVEGVQPGRYELVGRLYDGDNTITSVAAGRVRVTRGNENASPTLKIVQPTSLVDLRADQRLTVRWDDTDPDDNASVSFMLERADTSGSVVGQFVISPPFPEDPDGNSADSASLSLGDVLPGLYDLVGIIEGGVTSGGTRLTGTARLERAVRVLPAAQNDGPQLTLNAPAVETKVKAGESLLVRWVDSDGNDNARVSILIDDRVAAVGLNGNEKLLLASVDEDSDGAGDEALVLIPSDTAAGLYRVVGLITDGVTQVVTRAPGLLRVEEAGKVGGGASDDKSDDGSNEGDDDKSDDGGDDASDDKGDDGKTDSPGDDSGDSGSDDSGNDTGGDPTGDSGSGDDGNGNDDAGDDGAGGDDGSGNDDGSDDGGDKSDGGTDQGDDGKDDGGGKNDDPSDDKGDDGSQDPAPDDPGDDGGGNDKDDGPGTGQPDDSANQGDMSGLRPSGIFYVIDRPATRPRDPVRLMVSNEPSGGDFSIEVGARDQRVDEQGQLWVELPLSSIPNSVWPRTFDLVARPTGGVASSVIVSRTPVVVPQAVEVEDAALLNYSCTASGGVRTGTDFAGLEINWFGGGALEGDDAVTVEFWLSRDRFVPASGGQDATHRLLLRSVGSPNVVTSSRIALDELLGGGEALQAGLRGSVNAAEHQPPMSPGHYRLMVVEINSDGRRVVSVATAITPVALCHPSGPDPLSARP